MLQAGVAAAPGGVPRAGTCVSLALPLQDVEPKYCDETLGRGPYSTMCLPLPAPQGVQRNLGPKSRNMRHSYLTAWQAQQPCVCARLCRTCSATWSPRTVISSHKTSPSCGTSSRARSEARLGRRSRRQADTTPLQRGIVALRVGGGGRRNGGGGGGLVAAAWRDGFRWKVAATQLDTCMTLGMQRLVSSAQFGRRCTL